MTVYFASSEDIDFIITGTTAPSTTAGWYDSTYTRCSLNLQTSAAGPAVAIIPTGISTLYCSWRMRGSDLGITYNDYTHITIRDGATPVARWTASNGAWRIDTWDGGWVTRVSNTPKPPKGGLTKATIKYVVHASTGEFTIWLNDNMTSTWTGDTIGDTGITTVDTVSFTNPASNQTMRISEVIIADEQTINMRCKTLVPNGDGTNTAWTNGWSAVDETTESQADNISSDTANQVETMNVTAYAGTEHAIIKTVFVSAKAIRGASGPQNLQLAVHHGTTDDFSVTKALTLSYAIYTNNWPLNPDTASAWTFSELSSIETGVKSIT